MKQQYIAPQSEPVQYGLSCIILQESSLVDYYGGEDATVIDGEW